MASFHLKLLLRILDSICILGGHDNEFQIHQTFDMIEIKSGARRSGPPMRNARERFAAVANENCILVFGGWGREGRLDLCEYYDAIHGRWVDLIEYFHGLF